MEGMKKCKYCKSEIDVQAKICPNCRKKQNNVIRNVILVVTISIIGLIFFGVFFSAFILTITDTSPVSNNIQQSNNEQNTNNSIKEMKLNETYSIFRNDGSEYKIMFEGIRETYERNQFSELNPKKVIFVDYKYANISSETDIYISTMFYKIMDDEGNVLDTYPVSDDTRNAKAVPIGGKSTATDAYALMTDSKSITILYYDYHSKPLGKIEVNL